MYNIFLAFNTSKCTQVYNFLGLTIYGIFKVFLNKLIDRAKKTVIKKTKKLIKSEYSSNT